MAKENIQKVIGDFIKTERNNQNLSLVKLSQKSFGHPNYNSVIMKIEKGTTKDYSIETLDKILLGLGFDIRDVFKNK